MSLECIARFKCRTFPVFLINWLFQSFARCPLYIDKYLRKVCVAVAPRCERTNGIHPSVRGIKQKFTFPTFTQRATIEAPWFTFRFARLKSAGFKASSVWQPQERNFSIKFPVSPNFLNPLRNQYEFSSQHILQFDPINVRAQLAKHGTLLIMIY